MTDKELLNNIVRILDERKAENIVAYNVSKETTLTDYIVIATGNSDTHLYALTDYLKEDTKKMDNAPIGIDGYRASRWVCVDFAGVMVHLMCEDQRSYYDLEAIWGTSEKVDLSDLVTDNSPADSRFFS